MKLCYELLSDCRYSRYHFERGQYQDDVADLAAVFPPVLWPLQTGDAHVAPLEMLDVAAGTERENGEVSYIRGSPEQQQPTFLYINLWVERDAASRTKTLQLCAYIQLLWDIETMTFCIVLCSHSQNAEPRLLVLDASGGRRHALNRL